MARKYIRVLNFFPRDVEPRRPTLVPMGRSATSQEEANSDSCRYTITSGKNGRCKIDGYRPGGPRVRERFKVYEAACERRDEPLAQDNNREAATGFQAHLVESPSAKDAETAVHCLGDAYPGERWPLCRAVHFAKKELKHKVPPNTEGNAGTIAKPPDRISQLIEPFLAAKIVASSFNKGQYPCRLVL